MYTVYADNTLIHDSSSPIREMRLIDPQLKEVDSAAGTFDFTVPPTNPGYDTITRFTTTIIVRKEGNTIWTGRVITESEDFWKRRKFSCEGALAYLNDSMQPQAYYDNMNLVTFFNRLITNHNNRVNSNRQISVGAITMIDPAEPFNYKTEYKSTWDTIKDNFIDKLGGHIRIRYNGSSINPIIDYYKDYPNTATQEINFGENLLDFTKNWDMTNLCTIVIPRGKQLEEENSHGDKEYTTIASVNNGSIYLQNSTTVAKYGKVERVVDFSDCDNPTTLKSLGTEYLNSMQFDEMVLSVSAVDLHMINSSIQGFQLLDEVVCISYPHGLNKKFPITEIDTPLDKPEAVKYTMGTNVTPTMSSGVAASGKAFENKINTGLANTLLQAKNNAANILNAVTTGYVNIITDNDVSQALVIIDVPEYTNAMRYWKFNMNGLGYTNDGGQTYEMALTFDGTVTANYMHVGLIDDGYGYNRWNLTTGEFQMAYNTEIMNSSEETVTIVDIINLADANATNVEKSLRRQYGTYNLLNGTNTRMTLPSSNKTSEWSKGEWDGKLGGSATKKIVDVSGLPNSSIIKALEIKPLVNNYTSPSYFVQRNVEISPNQVYVASCYACATGSSGNDNQNSSLTISIGKSVDVNDSTIGYASASGTIPLDGVWRRYTFTFMTGGSNWSSDDASNKRAAVDSGKTDVMFGFLSRANNVCRIAGMTLERGNTATDWSESNWDTSDFSTYTANQEVGKLNDTLNNIEIFKRITSGNAAQGLYMVQGSLLINASYIKTGIMDAKLIRTGTITDATGKTKWDLTTSTLSTSNIVITGGSISFGSVKLNSGGLTAGSGNVIKVGSTITAGGKNTNGMIIGSKDALEFVTPYIRVIPKSFKENGYYTGSIKTGLTKEVKIQTVQWVRSSGDNISWQPQDIYLEITNGLITNVYICGDRSSNYHSNDDFDEEMGISD